MYRYKVYVTKIVDGDTVDVDIDLGFGMIYKKQRVRMMGIDTPESRTRDLEEKFYGKASKANLKKILNGKDVELVSHDKGKFGRILGDFQVYYAEQDRWCMVTEIMFAEGHGVPYTGGSKDDVEAAHLKNRKRHKV